MGYGDIPKYKRYIPTSSIFGIWDIPGISQKIAGTLFLSVFLGYGISLVYPKKIPVHAFFQFFGDMGYSRDIPKKLTVNSFKQKSGDMGYPKSIPKIVPYTGIPLFLDFLDLGQWITLVDRRLDGCDGMSHGNNSILQFNYKQIFVLELNQRQLQYTAS